jgi:hypothetical protein
MCYVKEYTTCSLILIITQKTLVHFTDTIYSSFILNLAINVITTRIYGPGSSVGIATDYGLDGPRIESR